LILGLFSPAIVVCPGPCASTALCNFQVRHDAVTIVPAMTRYASRRPRPSGNVVAGRRRVSLLIVVFCILYAASCSSLGSACATIALVRLSLSAESLRLHASPHQNSGNTVLCASKIECGKTIQVRRSHAMQGSPEFVHKDVNPGRVVSIALSRGVCGSLPRN